MSSESSTSVSGTLNRRSKPMPALALGRAQHGEPFAERQNYDA